MEALTTANKGETTLLREIFPHIALKPRGGRCGGGRGVGGWVVVVDYRLSKKFVGGPCTLSLAVIATVMLLSALDLTSFILADMYVVVAQISQKNQTSFSTAQTLTFVDLVFFNSSVEDLPGLE